MVAWADRQKAARQRNRFSRFRAWAGFGSRGNWRRLRPGDQTTKNDRRGENAVMTDLEAHVSQKGRKELVKQVRAKINELGIQYIYYQLVSVTGRIGGKGG